MPSMPGAPLFRHTCFKARCRLARSSTWASNALGRIDSGYPDDPATSSSCGVPAACLRRWSDAISALFVTVLRLSSFGAFGAGTPTMPSADFSTAFSDRYRPPSFETPKHRGDLPGKDALPSLHRRRIYETHPIAADRGLRGHVPARPECATPHIRF